MLPRRCLFIFLPFVRPLMILCFGKRNRTVPIDDVIDDVTQPLPRLGASRTPRPSLPPRRLRTPGEQEACWTLSNIVAGTSTQMAAVCDTEGTLGGVIDLLSGDVWEVQKEANFVISNVATASNGERGEKS